VYKLNGILLPVTSNSPKIDRIEKNKAYWNILFFQNKLENAKIGITKLAKIHTE
jgi:hypothetical protein